MTLANAFLLAGVMLSPPGLWTSAAGAGVCRPEALEILAACPQPSAAGPYGALDSRLDSHSRLARSRTLLGMPPLKELLRDRTHPLGKRYRVSHSCPQTLLPLGIHKDQFGRPETTIPLWSITPWPTRPSAGTVCPSRPRFRCPSLDTAPALWPSSSPTLPLPVASSG